MNSSQTKRMWLVGFGFVFAALIIIGRLIVFQVVHSQELVDLAAQNNFQQVIARPNRGTIYDHNGAVLAGNSADYQIGASPSLVTRPDEIATNLAPILGQNRLDILARLESNYPYVILANRVTSEEADAIRAHAFNGIQIDPLPRRLYPQKELMCHILGYTDFDGNGGSGLEGYYQRELAGEAASARVNISPLTEQLNVIAREGADIVLTIDRSVQQTVEQHLQRALTQYGAQSGTIIVMNPKTGAILAMASAPCYNPNEFYNATEGILMNPAVSRQYEPGSVMKLITVAAALDSGTVTPQTTYYDSGVIQLGGYPLYNWDRGAYGTVDMTTLLARSLNVGAATLAVWMGSDVYYNYMERFGFGRRTGIDLSAEAAGSMPLPGSSLWTETNLGTNSFGQGIASTPLQMISAVSALANDGYLMQPYLVAEIHHDGNVYKHEPTVLSRPIRPETAHQMTAMAVNAVRTEVYGAQVEGYTIAGKTGTSQIPENGIYHPRDTIASFVGWLPAEAPEIAVIIKLDRPTVSPWGSTTAAPAFAELASDLVVMLNIPPDEVRLRADIQAVRQNNE